MKRKRTIENNAEHRDNNRMEEGSAQKEMCRLQNSRNVHCSSSRKKKKIAAKLEQFARRKTTEQSETKREKSEHSFVVISKLRTIHFESISIIFLFFYDFFSLEKREIYDYFFHLPVCPVAFRLDLQVVESMRFPSEHFHFISFSCS